MKTLKMRWLPLLLLVTISLIIPACKGNDPTNPTNPTTKGDYVDLGLTSGTKWKTQNELNQNDPNGFFSIAEANELFGQQLPSKEQWMELVNECTWVWTGMGYKVIGTNNSAIVLPAAGCTWYLNSEYSVEDIGTVGYYWTSTGTWCLIFRYDSRNMIKDPYGADLVSVIGMSVRLVK